MDFSRVNWDVPGDYVVIAKFENPKFHFYSGFPASVELPLHIFDPAKPQIIDVKDFEDFLCLYFYQNIDPEETTVTLWQSFDSGKSWVKYSAENIEDYMGSAIDVAISPDPDVDFLFRVQCAGPTVSGLSNSFHFQRRNGAFSVTAVGGDRDDGDRGEQEPFPPLPGSGQGGQSNGSAAGGSHTSSSNSAPILKLPSSSSANSSSTVEPSTNVVMANASAPDLPASEAPMAPIPPAGQTFGALELERLMQANPDTVTFISGDIRVAIPTKALRGLSVSEETPFTIALQQPAARQISIRFYIGDTLLEEFPSQPFTLLLSRSMECLADGIPSCMNEAGKRFPASVMKNALSYSLDGPGTYTLEFSEAPSSSSSVSAVASAPARLTESTPLSDALTAAGWLFVLSGSVWLGHRFWRRKKASH